MNRCQSTHAEVSIILLHILFWLQQSSKDLPGFPQTHYSFSILTVYLQYIKLNNNQWNKIRIMVGLMRNFSWNPSIFSMQNTLTSTRFLKFLFLSDSDVTQPYEQHGGPTPNVTGNITPHNFIFYLFQLLPTFPTSNIQCLEELRSLRLWCN